MRVFVYEFVTGGGGWSLGAGTALGESLLAEGRAMAAAITSDLAKLPGIEVWTTRDRRVALFHDETCQVRTVDSADADWKIFRKLSAQANWTLLIAPEFDGILLARSREVLQLGGRLLSPGPEVVELASNKHLTVEHLSNRGIRTPRGWVIRAGEEPPTDLFPAVAKPLDGCGSLGVQLVPSRHEFRQLGFDQPLRLEAFVPGTAASVAVLCGPSGHWPLPACSQSLSEDGRFSYLGGETPLPPPLNERAQRIAVASVHTLHSPAGWLGVDLVLGSNPDGDDDTVIEINPRLTTSYMGLRALCRENLAAAMLAVAQGEQPALSWHRQTIQFTADGRIRSSPRPQPSDAP